MAQLLMCGISTHFTFNGNFLSLMNILEPQLAGVIMLVVSKGAQSVGSNVLETRSTLDWE